MRGVAELNLALELYREGVRFYVQLECAGGCRTFELKPKDVSLYLADRDAWAAQAWGVSKTVYDQWKQAGGFVQCAGNTAAGRRCRKGVAGPNDSRGMVDPPEFGDLIGGYCHIHDPQQKTLQ